MRQEIIMSGEQKEYISLHLELLKKALKDEGLCFAFLVDKKDFNKSSLAIVDVKSVQSGNVDGIEISLEKLNKGLIQGVIGKWEKRVKY